MLANFLYENLSYPYPSEVQKRQLMEETAISLSQINNWFINSRARLWKPLVDKAQALADVAEASQEETRRLKEAGLLPSGEDGDGDGNGSGNVGGGAAGGGDGGEGLTPTAAQLAAKQRPRHAANPRLSPMATAILRVWLEPQLQGRPATEESRAALCKLTGLSRTALERPAVTKLQRGTSAGDGTGRAGGNRSRSSSTSDIGGVNGYAGVGRVRGESLGGAGGASIGAGLGEMGRGSAGDAGGRAAAGGRLSPPDRAAGARKSRGGKQQSGKSSAAGGRGFESWRRWESLLSTASRVRRNMEGVGVGAERKRLLGASGGPYSHSLPVV